MDDVGISLDKRPAKAHLELLVAASSKLRKFSWCINFAVFPNSRKTRKLSSSKIKGYTVLLITVSIQTLVFFFFTSLLFLSPTYRFPFPPFLPSPPSFLSPSLFNLLFLFPPFLFPSSLFSSFFSPQLFCARMLTAICCTPSLYFALSFASTLSAAPVYTFILLSTVTCWYSTASCKHPGIFLLYLGTSYRHH